LQATNIKVNLQSGKGFSLPIIDNTVHTGQISLPQRLLGKTGLKVSIIGFGGIVVMGENPAHAGKVVAEAIEKGVNYFDVSPSYGDAELKLAPALKPFRKNIHLACKTGQRSRSGAADELKQSLKRLETDYLDVYQLHGLVDVEKDVKPALGKDGAIKTFIEAKKTGVIRNIGFSAHSPAAAITAMNEFDFDTIMFPVNFVTHFNSGLETQVLEQAARQNLGIIAIKAIAKQQLKPNAGSVRYPKCWYEPYDDHQTVELALNWTLSQNISLAIPSGEENLFRMCLGIAQHHRKLSESQVERLKEIASSLEPIFQF
jgi:aryl-alcohol dehydrogenase-like predicted oxidoreductase